MNLDMPFDEHRFGFPMIVFWVALFTGTAVWYTFCRRKQAERTAYG